MRTLSERIKIIKACAASAGAQTLITSDSIDMQGYESCLFLVAAQAITVGATTNIRASQDDASDGSFTDLLGTQVDIAADDDNQTFWVEVVRPSKRYIRCEITRTGANSAFSEIFALLLGAKQLPVVNNVTDTITGELHNQPSEGVA